MCNQKLHHFITWFDYIYILTTSISNKESFLYFPLVTLTRIKWWWNANKFLAKPVNVKCTWIVSIWFLVQLDLTHSLRSKSHPFWCLEQSLLSISIKVDCKSNKSSETPNQILEMDQMISVWLLSNALKVDLATLCRAFVSFCFIIRLCLAINAFVMAQRTAKEWNSYWFRYKNYVESSPSFGTQILIELKFLFLSNYLEHILPDEVTFHA